MASLSDEVLNRKPSLLDKVLNMKPNQLLEFVKKEGPQYGIKCELTIVSDQNGLFILYDLAARIIRKMTGCVFCGECQKKVPSDVAAHVDKFFRTVY